MRALLFLVGSNVFMTFAWYGHLKWFPTSHTSPSPLWRIIFLSWGLAFFEYCLQVPGNRIGQQDGLSTGQLKVMQEIITLSVFVVFSWAFLREKLSWNYFVAFALMIAAAAFVFMDKLGAKGPVH